MATHRGRRMSNEWSVVSGQWSVAEEDTACLDLYGFAQRPADDGIDKLAEI